jgi:hypothetical protein
MSDGWRSRVRTVKTVLTLWAGMVTTGRQVSSSLVLTVEDRFFVFVVETTV